MTPYVIDNKKRQEYFLFLIFFTVIGFGLGYFFGYQHGHSVEKATVAVTQPSPVDGVQKQAANVSASKEKSAQNTPKDNKKKPVKLADKTDKVDKKKNKKVVKKEKSKPKVKKKPKPKVVKSNKSKAEKPKKVTKKITRPEAKAKQIVQAKPAVKKPVVEKSAAVVKNLQSASEKQQAMKSVIQNKEALKLDKQVIENDLSDKKTTGYSVQAGMFAKKENAEKYADELKKRGFEAFVVDFISSSGKQKYNVRFGRFSQRNIASNKMAEYKKLFTTPAYIVINK